MFNDVTSGFHTRLPLANVSRGRYTTVSRARRGRGVPVRFRVPSKSFYRRRRTFRPHYVARKLYKPRYKPRYKPLRKRRFYRSY